MSSIDDSHTTTAPTQQQWSSDAERGAISYCRCSTVLVNLEDCVCGLCEVKTYVSCLFSGLYFFFCHATANVILHICCCRCFASLLETPDELEPKNNAQKVFLFFMKQLSNFWASALLFFVAWLVFFRPFAATPTLGASVVYEFELQGQPPGTMVGPSFAPQLRFNLSAHLLLKNSHVFYSIGYNHQAMAVFYAGEKLGPSDDMLPPFKLKPLGWTVLDQVVVGRLRNASGRLADAYRDELSQGQFQMLVKFWVNLTYKFWPFKAEYFYVYECPLLSPVPHAAGEPALSKPASCTRGAV